MTENLHEIAAQATETVGGLRPGDLVIDVGCNDGTLARRVRDERAASPCSGIDPSDVTRYAVAKGYDVVNDFFSDAALAERFPEPQGTRHHEHRDVLRPRASRRVRRRHRTLRSTGRHLGE